MRVLVAGLILAFAWSAAAAAAAEPAVTAIDAESNPRGNLRVTVTLTEPVTAEVFTLVNPYRLVIDLPDVRWRLASQPKVAGTGAILGLRFGRPGPGRARLVFDLAGPASLADVRLVSLAGPPGYRLDVALGPPGGTSTVEVAPEPGPEPPPAGTPLDLVTLVATALADLAPPPVTVPPAAVPTGLAPPLPARKPVIALPVIVIDAGHGGNDPGALAPTGLYEKELTLLAARELRDLLRRTGRFAVVLTRESDVFLPLEERVEIARRHEADLFISLHCDALDDRSVRGATVYTLSETASDAEAQALAAKENESDLLAAIDLASAEAYDVATTSILYDLARRDTMNVSARFAARLSEEVGRVMALRRNTHRFAGFRVLKAPDVPSVLFEMGYLSNAKDLRILANADSRRELLRAVVAAIDAHFAIVTASGA